MKGHPKTGNKSHSSIILRVGVNLNSFPTCPIIEKFQVETLDHESPDMMYVLIRTGFCVLKRKFSDDTWRYQAQSLNPWRFCTLVIENDHLRSCTQIFPAHRASFFSMAHIATAPSTPISAVSVQQVEMVENCGHKIQAAPHPPCWRVRARVVAEEASLVEVPQEAVVGWWAASHSAPQDHHHHLPAQGFFSWPLCQSAMNIGPLPQKTWWYYHILTFFHINHVLELVLLIIIQLLPDWCARLVILRGLKESNRGPRSLVEDEMQTALKMQSSYKDPCHQTDHWHRHVAQLVAVHDVVA